MMDTTRPEVGYIEELERALASDLYDMNTMHPDLAMKVFRKRLPQLFADAKLGQMVREAGPEIVEKVAVAMMSEVFLLTQPDRGDVFSWLDDHAKQIVLRTLQESVR